MFPKAFFRGCLLMLLSQTLNTPAVAQMPIGSIVAASPLIEAKSLRPKANWKQTEPFQGTLLLCGGGVIPLAIRDEFYQLGNGAEGSLVLIPTASPRSDGGEYTMWIDYWSGFRWKNVKVVHAANREDAFDLSLFSQLRTASAVWLSGGEQQRLSDRYAGTPIETELHALLARGGIVGGTSAGAAIASSNMIAGGRVDPLFSTGLQFLPKMIIDQHFTQRKRHGRLLKAIEAHPGLCGLGIDESTGLFVSKNVSRVVGDGSVYLLNPTTLRNKLEYSDDVFRKLSAGDSLDTAELLPIADTLD